MIAIRMMVMGAALAALASGAQAASHGKSVYERTCVACHGADGKGALPGIRPLAGKGGALAKAESVLLKNMAEGFQSPGSPMAMPPKGGDPTLTDEDLKAVLAYMRKTFKP